MIRSFKLMAEKENKKTEEDEKDNAVTVEEKSEEKAEVVEETTDGDVATEKAEESEEEPEAKDSKNGDLPEFRVGDTVKVDYKIIEGDKVRTQPYQGIVISKKGEGLSKTFTVRKIGADNIGVERIFPLFSPNIEKIKVVKRGKVRRAKLYYLRGRVGRKATQIKERVQPVLKKP